ncbi:hypothetical protein H311_03036 [Anncaliia algerae PRA109]|nr:hypothetical protein H311_03036 [Anncaliia algerae PRA109]
MEIHYSSPYEDIIFASRFVDKTITYKKVESGIKLTIKDKEYNSLKEILTYFHSISLSGFVTENCVHKIIKKRLAPASFNCKMLESININDYKFLDVVVFANAYKYYIEEKHISPNFMDLFLKFQEKLLEEVSFIKFEPGKFYGDIRVGKINEIVPALNSEKLFVEQVMFEKERQIVSGLRDKFDELQLLTKTFLFLINIKPRKIGGNLSEGMILCAKNDTDLEILAVENGTPGAKLHYSDAFPVVETYNIPMIDLQSEKGKILMESLSVKGGNLFFKDSLLFCENKKIQTNKVKDGVVS